MVWVMGGKGPEPTGRGGGLQGKEPTFHTPQDPSALTTRPFPTSCHNSPGGITLAEL